MDNQFATKFSLLTLLRYDMLAFVMEADETTN